MYTPLELDIAYRYPFSEEAKKVVGEASSSSIDYRYVELGKDRVAQDISGKAAYFDIEMDSIKLNYVLSYAYARLVASAMGPFAVEPFAEGEAERSAQALKKDSVENLKKVANALGIRYLISGNEVKMPFEEYVAKAPEQDSFRLVNADLKAGRVSMGLSAFIDILKNSAKKRIMAGLPIPKQEIPKEIIKAAAEIKLPASMSGIKLPEKGQKTFGWIERLLQTPIPDVRHRTVNLILAPYLVNVRNMSPEEAFKVINDYIERCKKVNPDTKIGEQYIRYQCNYAKKRGMRPLALQKAKELLGGLVELE